MCMRLNHRFLLCLQLCHKIQQAYIVEVKILLSFQSSLLEFKPRVEQKRFSLGLHLDLDLHLHLAYSYSHRMDFLQEFFAHISAFKAQQ
jgi:hypothetical protein